MSIPGGLRGLVSIRALYEVPRDNIASEVLIPGMRVATRVRIMAGFFSSQSFAQLAPGLAAFIEGDNEPLEMLISPRISAEDRDAIGRAINDPVKVANETMILLFEEARASQSAIAAHVVDCLSYLIAADRLHLRFVLMEQGMFHPKVWLLEQGDDVLAVHGSSNPTEAGLLYNSEAVSVDRPWVDGDAARERTLALTEMFEAYWHNKREKSLTVEASAGLRISGEHEVERIPTTDDFWRAWHEDFKKGAAPPLPSEVPQPVWISGAPDQRLHTPGNLIWETGRFAHQGRAVRAWEDGGRRGILAIATGGGKTVLSFIAATRLQNENETPLLVVVLAPTSPLVDQWEAETERFGIRAYVLGRLGAGNRIADLHWIIAGLEHGVSRTEVLICSNSLYGGSSDLRQFLDAVPESIRVLLVADEVHNLGTRTFLEHTPERAQYRLGLSATPIRQYDAYGTDALFDFFGPTLFEFGLDEAIAAGCLTPYRYHLHEVQLDPEEMDEWRRLTEQLRKRGFVRPDEGQGGLDEAIQRLLEARRSVLENAADKIPILQRLIDQTPASAVAGTLIYTSAKRDPLGRVKQITQVNRLLSDLGIISHQLTYTETGGPKARKIISAFADGDYQALTCMKVLDEGVDVPATTHAYILASSTVQREWVQRRGRVLRTFPGKEFANIHDYFLVPPDPESTEGRAILRGELKRADDFAGSAENAWDSDGPRLVMERYE